jgi:hypothetical protein
LETVGIVGIIVGWKREEGELVIVDLNRKKERDGGGVRRKRRWRKQVPQQLQVMDQERRRFWIGC